MQCNKLINKSWEKNVGATTSTQRLSKLIPWSERIQGRTKSHIAHHPLNNHNYVKDDIHLWRNRHIQKYQHMHVNMLIPKRHVEGFYAISPVIHLFRTLGANVEYIALTWVNEEGAIPKLVCERVVRTYRDYISIPWILYSPKSVPIVTQTVTPLTQWRNRHVFPKSSTNNEIVMFTR